MPTETTGPFAVSPATVPATTVATPPAAPLAANAPLPTVGAMATPSIAKPTVAAAVNAAVGLTIKPPAGVKRGSTRDIESGFMHVLIYGETDSRKTTTAAKFAGPKDTLFVLTRGQEQLMPVKNQGYAFVQVDSAEGLMWALQNPESAARWVYDSPSLNATEKANLLAWEKSADRTIIIDDTTEGANQIVDGNRTNEKGDELKDGRKIYGNSNIEFREVLNSLKRKPMHTIFISLSKVNPYGAENKETIRPNLPTGIHDLLVAELEYVFYLSPKSWKMTTARSSLQYSKLNDKGKMDTFTREIFAKNKLPMELATMPVLEKQKIIKLEEEMDLRALWERIKSAQKTIVK